MKLILYTTGGFTGTVGTVVREVSIDDLPEPKRDEIRTLVASARVFERPASTKLASPKPQDMSYRLRASDASHEIQIAFHLGAVDEPMRALVDWIEDEVTPVSAVKP